MLAGEAPSARYKIKKQTVRPKKHDVKDNMRRMKLTCALAVARSGVEIFRTEQCCDGTIGVGGETQLGVLERVGRRLRGVGLFAKL